MCMRHRKITQETSNTSILAERVRCQEVGAGMIWVVGNRGGRLYLYVLFLNHRNLIHITNANNPEKGFKYHRQRFLKLLQTCVSELQKYISATKIISKSLKNEKHTSVPQTHKHAQIMRTTLLYIIRMKIQHCPPY